MPKGSAARWFVTVFMLMFNSAHATSPLSPAPDDSFSVVVIPDTQGYRGSGTKREPDSTGPVTNPVFDAHTRWIQNNLAAQRIAFVTHVGDIVDRNRPEEWSVARTAMDRLHGTIPYGLVVGNHDMHDTGDSSLFQHHFPVSRFETFEWYGGAFEGDPERPGHSGNNANSYQLFAAGGLEFVVLHLECNAPDNVVRWANTVLQQYANRRAIISTHMDLGPLERPKTPSDFTDAPKGRMRWSKCHGDRGNTPEQLWQKLYRKHPNLLFVFSGDQSRTTALHLIATGDHGNTVHHLLSDYTSSGPLRIYRFLPARNAVQVITYDTTRDQLVYETPHVPASENHQFTIDIDLVPRNTAHTPE